MDVQRRFPGAPPASCCARPCQRPQCLRSPRQSSASVASAAALASMAPVSFAVVVPPRPSGLRSRPASLPSVDWECLQSASAHQRVHMIAWPAAGAACKLALRGLHVSPRGPSIRGEDRSGWLPADPSTWPSSPARSVSSPSAACCSRWPVFWRPSIALPPLVAVGARHRRTNLSSARCSPAWGGSLACSQCVGSSRSTGEAMALACEPALISSAVSAAAILA